MAQIDRHIDDPTGKTPHQLTLSRRRRLEVDSTNGANLRAERLIVLHKLHTGRMRREDVFAEDFAEIAARIFDLTRDYFQRSFDIKDPDFHSTLPDWR